MGTQWKHPERLTLLLVPLLGLSAVLSGCEAGPRPGLPVSSPFPEEAALSHGVALGDLTSTSAVLWVRTVGSASVRVEWTPETEPSPDGASAGQTGRGGGVVSGRTEPRRDFTASLLLSELAPGTPYRYRVFVSAEQDGEPPPGVPAAIGRFTTPPAAEVSQPVTLLWAGDLGGQQRCRRPEGGYAIFDRMLERQPAFALLLGDLVYSDDRCPSPPSVPGGDFLATTLNGFRAKHRYQRGDAALQRFLAAVPVYVTWDDHEIRNNFAGPYEPLMSLGRQALFEYWPIAPSSGEPYRLYRSIRYGADLEIFLLDTRQYRSRNSDPDGPGKTMLGAAQRSWLLDGLARSTATWKVIATSVPLAIPKPGSPTAPGYDSWARGADGTGFQTELKTIVAAMLERRIRNVVWLSADVHYVQINEYDPDRDGVPDFREFIAGPLAAAPGLLRPLDPELNPTTLYTESGYFNFGLLSIRGPELRVAIVDEAGSTRFERAFRAREDR
ncbi:alkaline phosphatase D family protein [Nitrospira sp. Kam-Ns4a]